MKRALGAVTTWDTFQRMTEGEVEQLIESKPAPSGVSALTEHHQTPVHYSDPPLKVSSHKFRYPAFC